MTSNQLRIWAAGFFDGEGSIFCARPKKGRPHLRAQLAQDHNPMLVHQFQVAVGTGIVYRSNIKRKNGDLVPRWTFVARSGKAMVVLKALWPYLGPYKKAQARQAIRNWRGNGY